MTTEERVRADLMDAAAVGEISLFKWRVVWCVCVGFVAHCVNLKN